MLSSIGFPGMIITILAIAGLIYLFRKIFNRNKPNIALKKD